MASAQAQRRGRHIKLKNKPTSSCGRVLTPSRDRELPFEDPGTPGMDTKNQNGALSPEMEPAAPQPRRPFAVPAGSAPGSPDSADQATNNELVKLWDESKNWFLPDGEGGVDFRPLSSVSTSAGPTPCPTTPGMTPCPEDRVNSSPFRPLAESNRPSSAMDEVVSSRNKAGTPKLHEGGDRSGVSSGPQSQSRKVFVGGVPQEMGQDDLYRFFNEHAPVKKAWLQKYRVGAVNANNPSNNHRGFGFVIFLEAKAVDDLLGPNNSRFLYPPGGGKLEVKRAVSSSDMQQEAGPAATAPLPAQTCQPLPSAAAARTAGSGQAAPVSPPEQAHAGAPWPRMQMAPPPQAAIMVAPMPWQGCQAGGHTLVQQLPAGFAVQGAVPLPKAASMTIPFQADPRNMGMAQMARGNPGPGMAISMPSMPCMASDGTPQQLWMTSVPAQAVMQRPLTPTAQPVQQHPEVAQQMGPSLSYWAAAVPVAPAAATGVVPQQQGASDFGRSANNSSATSGPDGMVMQQPQIGSYSVCNEAVTTAGRPYHQATAAQLVAAMPEYYEE